MGYLVRKKLNCIESLLLKFVGRNEPVCEEEPADDVVIEETDNPESAEIDSEPVEQPVKEKSYRGRRTGKQPRTK